MEKIKKKPLIVITGPTAVGKTDLSIRLAKDINGEIISADSIQIYKYMDIGSAKVMPEEMNGVVHHLIDELYPDKEFNVYTFKKMANTAMDGIYTRGLVPVIAGGTGFYIQSVLYDINFDESFDILVNTDNFDLFLSVIEVDENSEKLWKKIREICFDKINIGIGD